MKKKKKVICDKISLQISCVLLCFVELQNHKTHFTRKEVLKSIRNILIKVSMDLLNTRESAILSIGYVSTLTITLS